ncbi:hypothetical protein SynSYN20_01964 [Synechococcus sp. SYN20]|nr:hypothetical protein SynSYN20_01964 [Synechococcus sp. SYN20]
MINGKEPLRTAGTRAIELSQVDRHRQNRCRLMQGQITADFTP